MKKRICISVSGAVQGVGFRPFIYRLAQEKKLTGFVRNSGFGVSIEAEGDEEVLGSFLLSIEGEKPRLASIQSLEYSFLESKDYYKDFQIIESIQSENQTAFIMPDIAVCSDCLNELFNPADRRYLYPFINCTNCGPRYSIIEKLPYDRCSTTMEFFTMCEKCRSEYEDPRNRRFHAEPVACPECGPSVSLLDSSLKTASDKTEIFNEFSRIIKDGKIAALKGLGGYQLIADALNDEAVKLLRERKHRDRKPFAVMFPTLSAAGNCVEINAMEKRLLLSSSSPVVLIKKKKNPDLKISDLAAPGNPYLGIMLPYTPLHHILMKILGTPVIATSGNISEEPMCINEEEAFTRLKNIADYFLIHNRDILRPVDDSVVRIVDNREMILRRARGYAPLPINIDTDNKKDLVACGGHLKNTVSVAKGNNIFVSQHIGDLENSSAEKLMKKTVSDLTSVYNVSRENIVHDLHPSYRSTYLAREMTKNTTAVQHHHAHAASCYYENRMTGSCLAVCWDGTGYGTDGSIWGGEFFIFDGENFRRTAKLRDFILQGGDLAIKEPLRSAAGMLYAMFRERAMSKIKYLPMKLDLPAFDIQFQLLEKKINCFTTSSAGRIFDAVSYLLNISSESSYEGESAMMLEFAADTSDNSVYPFEIRGAELKIIDWFPMMLILLKDISKNIPAAVISARFHNTLIKMILSSALISGEKSVLLSGGCFQNMYLINGVIDKLQKAGLQVFRHQRIPPNDGGISFGQAALAAKQFSKSGG